MLSSSEIRSRFLEFFKKRGHTIVPSASLVPQNDPTVLFNTAGMQPLVPYLMGQPHPAGKRLANSQKCVRTVDIDEIGDNTHATFFEMLGNWSLGDYFKKDAIKWSYEFLTSTEEGLGLDPSRLYITVFGGNADAPRDEETYRIWRSLGIPEDRIYWMDGKLAEKNWWSAGESGPCGPDTEMFYDLRGDLNLKNRDEFLAADDRQDIVEIWNDVFMEYEKKEGKVIGKLANKNVDTGAGLERTAMVVQKKNNLFETDLFSTLIEGIRITAKQYNEKSARIVADHMRTAVFLIADGVTPSNTDQGYVLRRLLRRAVRHADKLQFGSVAPCVDEVVKKYETVYPELRKSMANIATEVQMEEARFFSSLHRGMKEFEKLASHDISGHEAFMLFTTYGFPFEVTKELAAEKGIKIDEHAFAEEFKKHQALSRAGAAQKFAGGLADHAEKTVQLHTAHHLLLRALQIVLGPDVHQRGSNITQERLRIDFAAPRKMTDEEKKEVERIVNEKIAEKLPVIRSEMSLEEAEKLGAEHEFGQKYPDRVSVYSVGPKDATEANPKFDKRFSIEFCGGPHIKNTSELGRFKILKEEAVAQGIRRIKAALE